ncbi:MAG: restriction endonuclease subunit S [Bacteroidales bacterium]|nr:restriction endonuclease subunit S [Bacteroidales bacterium]
MTKATQTIPKGYKQTEIGVIPEDWDMKELGKVAQFERGQGLSKSDLRDTGEYKCIHYGQLFSDYAELIKEIKSKTNYSGPYFFSKSNDVLVPTSDVTPRGLATASCIKEAGVLLGGGILIIRLNDDYDGTFFSYWVTQNKREILKLVKGSTVFHIYGHDMSGLKLAFPKDKEQTAIANALSDTDALIEKLEKLIAKKKAVKQGAMQQLLTGKKRLPGFSGTWEVKKLGEVGKCLRGVSYKGDEDLFEFDTKETVRLLRSNNIKDSLVNIFDIQFVNSAKVSPIQIMNDKDILICMANGSKDLVGKAGMFKIQDEFKYTFGAFMGCFRINVEEYDHYFIFNLFYSNDYKNYIRNLLAGSSINNLTPASIESMIFKIPEPKEQTAIATVLSDMDAEIEKLKNKLEKYRQIKTGMMQQLLTGKIRLLRK